MSSTSVRTSLMVGAMWVAMALPAAAFGEKASAEMKDAGGKSAGKIEISGVHGGALLKVKLTGLAPGPHAIHVHETGKCEGDFSSAGGIYNPLGAQHGFLNDEGPMSGDLPNIVVPPSGEVEVELLNSYLVLNKNADEHIFDEDGTALVIFEKADDYQSDPEGDAGARVLCGAITAEK